jgi:hypothetical protein
VRDAGRGDKFQGPVGTQHSASDSSPNQYKSTSSPKHINDYLSLTSGGGRTGLGCCDSPPRGDTSSGLSSPSSPLSSRDSPKKPGHQSACDSVDLGPNLADGPSPSDNGTKAGTEYDREGHASADPGSALSRLNQLQAGGGSSLQSTAASQSGTRRRLKLDSGGGASAGHGGCSGEEGLPARAEEGSEDLEFGRGGDGSVRKDAARFVGKDSMSNAGQGLAGTAKPTLRESAINLMRGGRTRERLVVFGGEAVDVLAVSDRDENMREAWREGVREWGVGGGLRDLHGAAISRRSGMCVFVCVCVHVFVSVLSR